MGLSPQLPESKMFWQQIRLCREQGVTILMVTNNKSDWHLLEQLATRTITLHKLAESSKSCQLVEDNLPENKQTIARVNAPKWGTFGSIKIKTANSIVLVN